MKKEFIIYGAGSVGKLAIQIVNDLNQVNDYQIEIKAIIDDDKTKINTSFCGYKVFGPDFFKSVSEFECVIISLSNNDLREKISKKLKKKFPNLKFPTIIHPNAWIGENVLIGEGSIVYPGVCIDPDVKLGTFNVVNKSVTIGHDTVIKDFVTLSPGVNIGGFNNIGKGSFIGIGASSLQFIKIGKNSTIGAGAVIIKDVPDGLTVVGNPGREV
jgi:sugar O-acyltransferase (sialic acid O-acetyltransferase NeuD family)